MHLSATTVAYMHFKLKTSDTQVDCVREAKSSVTTQGCYSSPTGQVSSSRYLQGLHLCTLGASSSPTSDVELLGVKKQWVSSGIEAWVFSSLEQWWGFCCEGTHLGRKIGLFLPKYGKLGVGELVSYTVLLISVSSEGECPAVNI